MRLDGTVDFMEAKRNLKEERRVLETAATVMRAARIGMLMEVMDKLEKQEAALDVVNTMLLDEIK